MINIARLLALSVLVLSTGFTGARADDIFVDEFNDNTGGIPEGWTRKAGSDLRPETSVIEGTSTVAITDFRGGVAGGGAPTMIDSPAFAVFPPESATTILNVSISETSSTGGSSAEVIFAFGSNNYSLRFKLSQSSDTLSIAIIDGSGALTEISGSPLAFSYDGGAVSFTLTFTSNSVRITSTLNSFDTGQLFISEFGLEDFSDINDLGPLVRIGLFSETFGADGTATVQFDRVSYVTDAAYTPPVTIITPNNSALKASLLAQIKKLQKKSKSAKRSGNASKLKKLSVAIKALKKRLSGL